MNKEEQVKSMISINRKQIEENNDYYLFFVTASGLVKRVHINEFERIRQSGKIAISLRDDDQLVSVKLTGGNDQILIAASNGKLVRFEETNVRPMGRSASGVKGINVDGSEVIGMTTDKEGKYIRRERYAGNMSRSFYVGKDITEKDIHGKYENGILMLDIPKKEEKPQEPERKLITIE